MAGIYIHIPFCKTRCTYCDFYSTTDSSMTSRYIQAVCKELINRKDYLDNEPIETIYLGGGTPSQLSVAELTLLFETIYATYDTQQLKEITLEANPDDLSKEYLQALQTLPINRLSIGVQTFDDNMLKKLNRRHSATQALQAISMAQDLGFDNISLDLIYGLPSESMEKWIHDIQTALDLTVSHISAYHLIYEKGTVLEKQLSKGIIHEVDEEFSLQSFTKLIGMLTENGFTHYEISNFAKNDKISIHNSSYWRNSKYLGCGPSAHSYNQHTRDFNTPSLQQYITNLENNQQILEVEYLDTDTRYNDYIITSLRTMWGLSLETLKKEFGDFYYNYALKAAEKHIKSDFLELKNNKLKLTQKGIFLSDGIMSDLLHI